MDSSHRASRYIHSLSPVKKSQSNIPYYNFNLQPQSDISFEYANFPGDDPSFPGQEAVDVSLHQVSSITPNQAVNTTATISFGDCSPKKICVKSTGKSIRLKEDCIVEDTSGNCEIHVWEPLFLTLQTEKTYKFTSLAVKHFKGSCFLATKPNTTVEEVDQQINDIKGPQLLNNPHKQITLKRFSMVKGLSVFFLPELPEKDHCQL
eukprot:gene1010-330_t